MQVVLLQLIYFAFLQSVFLLGIYTFSRKIRKAVNPYLIVLIAVMMIGMLGKIWVFSFDGILRWYSLSEYSVFLLGATVYLFTKSSLTGTRTFSRKDLVHYLPGVVYSVVISYYYVFAPREVVMARLESGELFWMVVLFMGSALLVNWFYWIKSVRLFLATKRKLANEASYALPFGFFHNFLIAVGVCLLCWLTFYFLGIAAETFLEREVRQFVWVVLGLLILFLSYYTIREPEVFKVAQALQPAKYAQSRLSEQELEDLQQRLDQLMKEQKPYLNRSLMKADLAQMLGVHKPDVARLLNEKVGMNFFEYVNYFRIKEFIELAKMGKAEQLTLFGIAQEAGFNSKTTFNKSFKKIMGTSPSDYFSREMA